MKKYVNRSKKNRLFLGLSHVDRFFRPLKSISSRASHFRLIKSATTAGQTRATGPGAAAGRRTRERAGGACRLWSLYGMLRRQGAGASKLRAWAIYDYWEKGDPQCKYCQGLNGTWAIKSDHLGSIKLFFCSMIFPPLFNFPQ